MALFFRKYKKTVPVRLIVTLTCIIPFQMIASPVIPLSWEIGYSKKAETAPERWISARVPGAVQLDIAKAEKWGPYYFAENWKDYLPLEDYFYTYRTSFQKPELKTDEHLYFISQGIDYEFDILLNGEKLLHQEGMFTPVKLDLTSKLKSENDLRVFIYPVPKSRPSPADRRQADHVVKPAVSYGWDWHPRLVPLGIWDETGLLVEPGIYVVNYAVEYTLDSSFRRVSLIIHFNGRNFSSQKYEWDLLDASGHPVLSRKGSVINDSVEFKAGLNNPQLWWPHDQGIPYLYSSRLILKDNEGRNLQTIHQKIGFRRIRLVLNHGEEQDAVIFPKSRRLPPIQFEVNGRNVFCKGTNWLNPEIFPGIIDEERYRDLLDQVLEANFNILRVWGGGIVNKESFFNLCDEKGILVWQEFPLACNNYPDDSHYLKILRQEATSIILRLKKHSSLALWCGGNELFNGWSGMNDQSLPLRLLNSLCFELDPSTPFIPTSPLQGMGHGHYVFRDPETHEEVYQRMKRADNTAYTEFGVPSPSSVDILRTIIPANELWPPHPGASWESHHAYNSWIPETWLMQDMIEYYFGKSANIEELVAHGQLMQGEGYKYIFESARRQKPHCSMAINWCYNEPWPTAANNNIVSWPNIPKPGFYQVKNACRPFLASATIEKFLWKAGETFSTGLWILSDLPNDSPGGKINAFLCSENQKLLIGTWDYSPSKANTNLRGPILETHVPNWPAGMFRLVLEDQDHPGFNSEYILLIQK